MGERQTQDAQGGDIVSGVAGRADEGVIHDDHRDYNKPDEVEPVCRCCNAGRPTAIRYGKDAVGNMITITEGVICDL